MGGKKLATNNFVVCAAIGILGFSTFCLGNGVRLSRIIDLAFAIPRYQTVSVQTCKLAARSLSEELASSQGFRRKSIVQDWNIRNNKGCEEDPTGTFDRIKEGQEALHKNERLIQAAQKLWSLNPQ